MSWIIYEGKSQLDSNQIVCIITNKTSNKKTGNCLQSWILLKDQSPIEASKTGNDYAICGDCIHRGKADGAHALGRSCYVNIVMGGPNQVWKAYKAGRYKYTNDFSFAQDKIIRYGAYGDPLAVPERIWLKLQKYESTHLGYTHQWRTGKGTKYLMASVDSEVEYVQAKQLGYRTFRVGYSQSKINKNEINCPASKELGYKRTCETCLACDGNHNNNSKRRDIFIRGHGSLPTLSNLERNLKML